MSSLPVGLCGSYGGLNTGDEAILTAAIEQLRAELPEVRLTVFTRDVDHTRANHDVERVVDARTSLRGQLIDEIQGLAILLLGGGGILYDREAEPYLHLVRIAQNLGVRTGTYAIGAGPLRREEDRRAVAEVLNHMSCITVRDAPAGRLLEDVGVERDIAVTADPAVLLTPVQCSLPPGARGSRDGAECLVALSVREHGDAAEGLRPGVYHQVLAHAADFVAARFDAQLVFVPMEHQDLSHSHRVVAEMALPDRATVLKPTHSPRELLGLISQFDFALGMRLHFVIFAALAGVPVLALPYARKVAAFVERLGLPTLDLGRQEHADTLLACVDRMWDEREAYRRLMRASMPAIKDDAMRTAQIVAEAMELRAAHVVA